MSTYPNHRHGFETEEAKQLSTPIFQDKFITAVRNKEKKLLKAHILDDNLRAIFAEVSEVKEGQPFDADDAFIKLDEEFINDTELKSFCTGNSIQAKNIPKDHKGKITGYYHKKTTALFEKLEAAKPIILLPSKNASKLGATEYGLLCYRKAADDIIYVDSPSAYVEIDKITWIINNKFDFLNEDYVKSLCNIVFKIAVGRLLASILHPYDLGSRKYEDMDYWGRQRTLPVEYADHLQLLVSFTVLYRLCKHGRRVDKSVVQVGRFIAGSKKMNLYTGSIKSLLIDSGLGNIPVVIVSGYGLFRCGKSFFLNLMIKWCEAYVQSKGLTDDLKLDEELELTGFESSPTDSVVTKGLWMWRKPFIILNKEKKKVALIFMDSEGIGQAKQAGNPLAIPYCCLSLSDVCIQTVCKYPSDKDLDFLKLSQLYRNNQRKDLKKPFGHLIRLYRDSYERKGFYPRPAVIKEANTDASSLDDTGNQNEAHPEQADSDAFSLEIENQIESDLDEAQTEDAFNTDNQKDNNDEEDLKDIKDVCDQAQLFYLVDAGQKVRKGGKRVGDIDRECLDLCYELFKELFGLKGQVYNYGCEVTDLIGKIEELEKDLADLPDVAGEIYTHIFCKSLVEDQIEKWKIDTAKDLESNLADGTMEIEKNTESLSKEMKNKVRQDFCEAAEKENDTKPLRMFGRKHGVNKMASATDNEIKGTKLTINLSSPLNVGVDKEDNKELFIPESIRFGFENGVEVVSLEEDTGTKVDI